MDLIMVEKPTKDPRKNSPRATPTQALEKCSRLGHDRSRPRFRSQSEGPKPGTPSCMIDHHKDHALGPGPVIDHEMIRPRAKLVIDHGS